jgi:hypothetical protein
MTLLFDEGEEATLSSMFSCVENLLRQNSSHSNG